MRNLSEERERQTLDFKRLGLGALDCATVLCKVERDYTRGIRIEKGEVVVHQARYMIFDNRKLYAPDHCRPKHLTK